MDANIERIKRDIGWLACLTDKELHDRWYDGSTSMRAKKSVRVSGEPTGDPTQCTDEPSHSWGNRH